MTLEERNDLLDRAQALVLQGWTQGANARNAEGKDTYSARADATCWCVYGACFADREAYNVGLINQALAALETAAKSFGYTSAPSFNDTPSRTKYEVAALFDHAKLQPLEATSL